MLRPYDADLHIHSVLSPCASYRMAPSLIVRQAKRRAIDVLAITDHNSAENVASLVQAAAGTGIRVIPGMEVETEEEVHVVVLFDTTEQVLKWQEFIYVHLPLLDNDERFYGVQLVVDAEGRFLRKNPRRLMVATDLSVDVVVSEARNLGGFCVPAHVDRPSYSILANLGFVPEYLDLPALELSRNAPAEPPDAPLGKTLIRSSDAHDLVDIGWCRTRLLLAEPTVREFDLACRGQLGRTVLATQISPRKTGVRRSNP